MDNTTVNTADITSGEATEKTTPEVSTGTETVASENNETAGGSQDTAEGSKAEGQSERRRGPTKLDTIRELRAERRERDAQIQTLMQEIKDMKDRFTPRSQDQKPSKRFWDAPEEFLDERLNGHLSEMERRIYDRMEQRDVLNQQTAEWKQETSDATEFIRSQKGITQEDHDDIAEIIRSTPEMQRLSPMQRARYGLFLWQQERGISDKTALKARATSVVGAPPAAGGAKVWTSPEIDRVLASEFGDDPKYWDKAKNDRFDAFRREIETAQKQGRLK